MKPRVILKCVAESHNDDPDDRIIEFSHKNGGGLISIRAFNDGTLMVGIYRQDPTVCFAIQGYRLIRKRTPKA